MSWIIVAALTGAGVVTGLLFAFSNFVMRALAKLPNEQAMSAMQQINEKIINPIFLLFFLGTPLLCAAAALSVVFAEPFEGRVALLAGSIGYLIGPFGITIFFNVPLNNRLAEADLVDADTIWTDYQIRWQRWNHVRTYVGIISMVLLAVGLSEMRF